ncbi:hypothetical protein EVAR_56146_1 [Eumeta japonica]|uniref:Uncharacterized protein n=1 Tax=Eumeta variegata TaxID=151549 RepID=A0A4C1Y7C9_EUMVA|nr:hypothetical protein EVAR_56146_1 [Eumeta japonica]
MIPYIKSKSRITTLHLERKTNTHLSNTAARLLSPLRRLTDSSSKGARRARDYFNHACQSAPAGYPKADYIRRWPNDPQRLCSLREEARSEP